MFYRCISCCKIDNNISSIHHTDEWAIWKSLERLRIHHRRFPTYVVSVGNEWFCNLETRNKHAEVNESKGWIDVVDLLDSSVLLRGWFFDKFVHITVLIWRVLHWWRKGELNLEDNIGLVREPARVKCHPSKSLEIMLNECR